MIDLDLYKTFYTVARCGSLSKAAKELYISQPAVSQAVKQLELELDTPLFNRVHHGMELTEQGGKLIFDDVERALESIADAEEKLAALKSAAVGTLRIGASETIFQYILSDKIVKYRELYPKVKIDIISDVSPKIIELMRRDECDIGFLNLPVAADGIKLEKSVRLLNDIFIAGKKFGDLKGVKLSVSDLCKYPLLLMEEHTVSRDAVDHYAANHGVRFDPAVEINSWGLMKKLVEGGMGIGCIPREYALNRLSYGSVFELDVTPPMPVRSVAMALPEKHNKTFALQAFVDMFAER